MQEYDDETMERVHRENIRRSKIAQEKSSASTEHKSNVERKQAFKLGVQPPIPPRKVYDNEISEYQGLGDRKQMLKAQARKRRQVRNRERSVWDNIAPKEMHGLLSALYIVVFILGMLLVAAVNGFL